MFSTALEHIRAVLGVIVLSLAVSGVPALAQQPLTQDTTGGGGTVPVFRPSAPPPGKALPLPENGVEVPDGSQPAPSRSGTIFDTCRAQPGIGDTNRPIYCRNVPRR